MVDMTVQSGSESRFLSEGDWEPFIESATAPDGTLPVCIIKAGWSKNGRHYSESVLKKAAKIYRAGTHNFWNHPGPGKLREQPSGDLNDLASVLSEDAHFDPVGPVDPRTGEPCGPGLYARVRPVSTYADRIRELAGVIGLSHRVNGRQRVGVVDGRRGHVVEEIFDPADDPKLPAVTVDWVARPAAGGRAISEGEGETMTDEFTEEAFTELKTENARLKEEVAAKDRMILKLTTDALLTRAETIISEEIAKAELSERTAERVRARADPASAPSITESESEPNVLDEDAWRARIAGIVKEEVEYAEWLVEERRTNAGVAVGGDGTLDPAVKHLMSLRGRH